MSINDIKHNIIKSLNESFRNKKLSDLPYIIQTIEQKIVEIIKINLADFLLSCGEEIKGQKGKYKFLINGCYWSLAITTDNFLKPRQLCIGILQFSTCNDNIQLMRTSFKINGIGRYTEAEIIYPIFIKQYINSLNEIVCITLNTGYAWILEFIRNKISDIVTDLSIELYSYLRMIFSSFSKRNILERIWLYASADDKAFYLLDHISSEETIKLAKNIDQKIAKSPAELFTEFLTTILPFELSNSSIAISEGRSIDIDLRQSKYLSKYFDYSVNQAIFYGTYIITIFPIVREGNKFLLIVFPTHIKEDVFNIIEKYSNELAIIFNRHKRKASSIWKELKVKISDLSLVKMAGEFTGGILKGLIEE